MDDVEHQEFPVRRGARPGFLLFPHIGPIPQFCCRADKLEIAVDGTIAYATPDHLRDTLGLLSSDTPNRPRENRVLNAPRGRERNRLSIRQDAWLFGGLLTLKSIGATSCRAILNFSLNPTRVAEHVRLRFAPRSLRDLEQIPLTDLLRNRQDVADAIAAETLDGNDNILSGSPWAIAVSREWPAFVAFYATQVCRLVEEDLNSFSEWQNAISQPYLRFHLPDETCPSIGYAEQYVEFWVHDARKLYNHFERGIWPAAGFTDTEFRCHDGTGGIGWYADVSAESSSWRP